MSRGHSDRRKTNNKGAVFQRQPGTVPKAVMVPSELRATLASSFPEVCEPRYVSLQVCSDLRLAACLSSLLLAVRLYLLGTDHPAPPSQPSFGGALSQDLLVGDLTSPFNKADPL